MKKILKFAKDFLSREGKEVDKDVPFVYYKYGIKHTESYYAPKNPEHGDIWIEEYDIKKK